MIAENGFIKTIEPDDHKKLRKIFTVKLADLASWLKFESEYDYLQHLDSPQGIALVKRRIKERQKEMAKESKKQKMEK